MKPVSKPFFWYGLFLVTFVFMFMLTLPNAPPRMYMVDNLPKVMYNRDGVAIPYDENIPLIFVGGMPRSGTTLMRAMLDSHPDVRCGEETHVVPLLLGMRANLGSKEFSRTRLKEAGITGKILDSATRAFILEIIAHHGEPAKYLCNKDPFTQKSSVYLKRIFPNAKFLFMIRDGRATVHSIITRNVTIGGFNLKSYKQCLSMWSRVMTAMYAECLQVGSESCMPVYYEQLVLQPAVWMRRVTDFLGIPWNESVLHHEDYIGKAGGVSMTNAEPSSDQIIKPVNVASLYTWVGEIPQDVVDDMPKIAPMLRTLGYDPLANPPNYGEPDPRISNNTLHIEQDAEYWQRRADEIADSNPLKNLTLKYQEMNRDRMEKMQKRQQQLAKKNDTEAMPM